MGAADDRPSCRPAKMASGRKRALEDPADGSHAFPSPPLSAKRRMSAPLRLVAATAQLVTNAVRGTAFAAFLPQGVGAPPADPLPPPPLSRRRRRSQKGPPLPLHHLP